VVIICPSLLRPRARYSMRRFWPRDFVFLFLFSFFFLGPVQTGRPPPLRGRAASESLACFNFLTRAGMCRVPGRRRMGVGFKIGLGGTYPPALPEHSAPLVLAGLFLH
jgi:hypothetical protein